jgi:hypothetical protein
LNRRARRLEGDPEVITEGVETTSLYDPFFSVARNGTVAWRPGKSELCAIEGDRSGRLVGTSGPPGLYSAIVPSPDGKRLLVDGRVGTSSISVSPENWTCPEVFDGSAGRAADGS